jgi:hypothetical protein
MTNLQCASPAPSGANQDEQAAAGQEDPAGPARELAQRLSGAVEVLLLWRPESDRVELAVHDLAMDVTFHLEVAPDEAIDAFNHPFAYLARLPRPRRQDRAPLTVRS